jgi:predicted transcriptional regulator
MRIEEPISSLMNAPVWSVGMDDTVAAIEQLMTAKDLSWVPVVGPDGAAVGVVTRSDLLQFHQRGQDAAAVAAWLICSYKPFAVDAATSIARVAQLMLERKAHHAVVTVRGGMVGVVSALDFVRLAAVARR